MHNLRASLIHGCILLPALLMPAGVLAQSQSVEASATQADDSGAIIVTARRRAENLENVPTAITAFGAAQLAERNIRTEEDLQAATPGLVLRQTQGQNQLNYSIRGQTVDAFTGSAASVVPYVNDVQQNVGGASSFFDLESVQVLKGPQGTLFGRNATGGAVLYATAKPTNDFGGFIDLSGGNYNFFEGQGAINLPVITDKVLLRLAFDVARRDGYQLNTFYDTKLGSLRNQTGRLSLTLKPIEGLKNDTVFEYGHSGGTNTGLKAYSIYTHGQKGPDGTPLASTVADTYSPSGLGAGWAAYIAGNPNILRSQPNALAVGLPGFLAYQATLPFWTTASMDGSQHDDKHYFVTNTTTYDVASDALIKNIIGYSYDHSLDNTPQQGIPYGAQYTSNLNLNEFGNDVRTRSYSEELQLQGKAFDKALTYIIGGYYQHTDQHIFYPQTYYNIAPLPGVNGPYGFGNTSDYMNKDTTKAIFAQGTYDLGTLGLRGLSVTGGFRYTWERVSLRHLARSTNRNGEYQSSKFSKPSWEVGLEYQVTPTLLTYVKTRGSWRTGGLNGNAAPINAPASGGGDEFAPETVKDVEAGLKFGGDLMGRPAHLNIAIYKMWIKNVQRFLTPVVCTGGVCYSLAVTANVPSADVQGVEAEGAFKPVDWLTLGGSIAYTDAKFKNNIALLYGVNYLFNPYPDTPKVSGSAYAQIGIPIAKDMGEMSLRGDVYAQTGQYFSANAGSSMPGTRLPGYKLVNLRLDWRHVAQSHFTVSAFVRNLTNEEYFVGGAAAGASFGMNAAAVGRPRMFGGEVRFDF